MFYILLTESEKLHITPLKEVSYLQEKTEVLLPSLPLSVALCLLDEISNKKTKAERSTTFWTRWRKGEEKVLKRDRDWLKEELLKVLQKRVNVSQAWHWEGMESFQLNSEEKIRDKNREDFQARTAGRLLAKADLQRLGKECHIPYAEVLFLCHEQISKGYGEWIPAVIKDGQGWRCQRCGGIRVEEWVSIYGLTATCVECTVLGAVSSLHALYRSIGPPDRNWVKDIKLVFSPRWELSKAQRLASQDILKYVQGDSTSECVEREILLWAACGAGKTEVCFPATAWALERGKRVLFAAPRQDVIHDVAPRLQEDFPDLQVSVLTGISPEHFASSHLVIATTHQILRFYQAFDVIFLDEMDAFPYYGNNALAWGIQQALRLGGKIVYLTATPTTESLDKVRRGKMGLIRIPARHHRRAIPMPEWRKVSEALEPERFSRHPSLKVWEWLKESVQLGPILIFVPKISWVNSWVDLLQSEFPEWTIAGSYSSDPARREKVDGLRRRKYDAFVCTSILERGITIPDAQVVVLQADHELFDVRALVQMAGRVGRTQENPTGSALFLAAGKTPGMEKAMAWIREQNEIALTQGLID
ncbi:helicase-related protein [Desulfitobacterium sp. THU1]|uniref:helicase-related protein n=1 Tax=Desulfitobacterium sp. THU1 TaxID=3138072 RepID=UPI00312039D2